MRVAVVFDYFGVIASKYGQCEEPVMKIIKGGLYGKHKLAILSNMSSGTTSEMLGKDEILFDEVILSANIGIGKPDIRAFLLAAQTLGEFPSNCIIIDDSAANCAAAESLGMRAIHYVGPENLQQKLQEYGILTP